MATLLYSANLKRVALTIIPKASSFQPRMTVSPSEWHLVLLVTSLSKVLQQLITLVGHLYRKRLRVCYDEARQLAAPIMSIQRLPLGYISPGQYHRNVRVCVCACECVSSRTPLGNGRHHGNQVTLSSN